MDAGTLGAISTVLVTLAFAGVCWWAFAPRRKKRFDDASKVPFAEDENDRVSKPDDTTPKDGDPQNGQQETSRRDTP